MTDVAVQRQQLLRELDELHTAESQAELMSAFKDSLGQAADALKHAQSDTAAATGKIDEAKEALDGFREVVEGAKSLIESEALERAGEGAEKIGDSYDAIKDGVSQFGDKAGEVAGALENLEGKLAEIDRLQNLGGDQAGELLRSFGSMLENLTETLGPLLELVPGIGAFLEFYAKAVQGIAASTDTIISVMKQRNVISQDAGMGDIYVFTDGAKSARQKRIAEIEAKLDELGWDTPTPGPKQPTTNELIDVQNAVEIGLKGCGCGTGGAADWGAWRQRRKRLQAARTRLNAAIAALAPYHDHEIVTPPLDHFHKEVERATVNHDKAQKRLSDANAEVERVGATPPQNDPFAGGRAMEEQRAALNDANKPKVDLENAKDRLEAREALLPELEAANKEFEAALADAEKCYDLMEEAMPDSLPESKKLLKAWHSPRWRSDGWLRKRVRQLREAEERERKKLVPVATPASVSGMSPVMVMMLVIGALMTALIGGLFVLGGGDDAPEDETVAEAADESTVEEVDTEEVALDAADVADEVVEAADEILDEVEEEVPETVEERVDRLVGRLPARYEDLVRDLIADGRTDDEIDERIDRLRDDEEEDGYYSDEEEEAGNEGPDIDLIASDISRVVIDAAQALALFGNTVYECGVTEDGRTTTCDTIFTPAALPEGEMVIATMVFADDVASGPWTYTYSAVFDSNGDPADDWVPIDPFNWDQYQGTDRWYVLDIVNGQFSLGRFDGSFGFPVQTGARVVVSGNVIRFFIPGSELGPEASGRVTSFRHDGTFAPAASAGDSNGANPTEPLLPIEPIEATFTTAG